MIWSSEDIWHFLLMAYVHVISNKGGGLSIMMAGKSFFLCIYENAKARINIYVTYQTIQRLCSIYIHVWLYKKSDSIAVDGKYKGGHTWSKPRHIFTLAYK